MRAAGIAALVLLAAMGCASEMGGGPRGVSMGIPGTSWISDFPGGGVESFSFDATGPGQYLRQFILGDSANHEANVDLEGGLYEVANAKVIFTATASTCAEFAPIIPPYFLSFDISDDTLTFAYADGFRTFRRAVSTPGTSTAALTATAHYGCFQEDGWHPSVLAPVANQ